MQTLTITPGPIVSTAVVTRLQEMPLRTCSSLKPLWDILSVHLLEMTYSWPISLPSKWCHPLMGHSVCEWDLTPSRLRFPLTDHIPSACSLYPRALYHPGNQSLGDGAIKLFNTGWNNGSHTRRARSAPSPAGLWEWSIISMPNSFLSATLNHSTLLKSDTRIST